MSGKLIEVLVEEGDTVEENQVIAFVKQMKMELEIRAPQAGTIKWAIELDNEEGDDVAEGVLLAELEDETKKPDIRSRL
jgi:biotin carboxyl carrier protein